MFNESNCPPTIVKLSHPALVNDAAILDSTKCLFVLIIIAVPFTLFIIESPSKSLTKIMTLYILFDQLKNNQMTNQTKLKVSKIAASRSPSKLYLGLSIIMYFSDESISARGMPMLLVILKNGSTGIKKSLPSNITGNDI